ncbi:CGNR zinc finger domain-containing protein [Streptoalloteichus hindustanus]|uniref:Putative stress-induced transcription regulator n=1 Tax=Streptoalloteichus hindustanus TaxID=2017 RepID=A0A1M5FQR5_STRHI|nr:CGNR zinc finger domain-containing protein [Streptoalloteichus hindustanus]SHF93836.1 Putative stress-induced transcription regulator [Streptoalloteichus hindustanus]
MRENHYYGEILRLVTDFTNAPLVDLDDLRDRVARTCLGRTTPAKPADLAETRQLVAHWTRIVDADSERHRVDLLNGLLAEAAAYPRITDHDDSGWHLHYRDDGVPLAAVLRAVVAVAAAQHLTELGMHRLGRCALAECRFAFVDFSRGGRQRYCSRVCANRDAVRRHRQSR